MSRLNTLCLQLWHISLHEGRYRFTIWRSNFVLGTCYLGNKEHEALSFLLYVTWTVAKLILT